MPGSGGRLRRGRVFWRSVALLSHAEKVQAWVVQGWKKGLCERFLARSHKEQGHAWGERV